MGHFDAVVVGCGALGSSVSYNLASRGLKVLTVEKFGLNHPFGSSHGKSRIIRLAYFEDPRYVPLLKRAYESWLELQDKVGKEIISVTGGLMIGPRHGELIIGAMTSAKTHGLPHRVLSGSEANDEFSAFRLGPEYSAVHDPNAGILFPEQCISSYVELAKEAGGVFRFTEPLTRWEKRGDGFEIVTTAGKYSTDKVVVCAGAWAGQLLGGLVPLQVERQAVFWFDSSGSEKFARDRMPVFIMEEGGGHYFYGIPDIGDGVKVARHHEGMVVDPEFVDRDTRVTDSAPVQDFVARTLPDLGKLPTESSVCLYSNTPDKNFAVDFHPDDRNLIILSACSGHGFKFASVLGEVVADMVEEGRTIPEISFLGVRRFLGVPSAGLKSS